MKAKILFISMIMLSCQAQKVEIFQCEEEVCLQLRNHDDASVPWWKFWAKKSANACPCKQAQANAEIKKS